MEKKLELFVPLSFLILLVSCGPSDETINLQKKAKAIFGFMPYMMPGSENDTEARIALGKKLFFDTILSVNRTQSCSSCHNVHGKSAGVDNLPTSPGAMGKNGDRNTPTVLNAGFHFVQFWDGRAKDLKEQAKNPILNPKEMAMPDESTVVKRLVDHPEYPGLFSKAFPEYNDPITYDNLAESIASFERTLITYDRLNDFINGDHKALSKLEQEGLELFITTGCATCHNGVVLGGNCFSKVEKLLGNNAEDTGRFQVTKDTGDKFLFKVPSLRNIALTKPYFHNGKVKTLFEAVQSMASHQLGKELSEAEVAKIVKFLEALSDKNRL